MSARLGHSDVGTTQRIYVHAYDAARRSSARRDRLTALYAPSAEAGIEASEQQTPLAVGGEVAHLPANSTTPQ